MLSTAAVASTLAPAAARIMDSTRARFNAASAVADNGDYSDDDRLKATDERKTAVWCQEALVVRVCSRPCARMLAVPPSRVVVSCRPC